MIRKTTCLDPRHRHSLETLWSINEIMFTLQCPVTQTLGAVYLSLSKRVILWRPPDQCPSGSPRSHSGAVCIFGIAIREMVISSDPDRLTHTACRVEPYIVADSSPLRRSRLTLIGRFYFHDLGFRVALCLCWAQSAVAPPRRLVDNKCRVCLSVCLHVCLSVRLSVCLSVFSN